MNSATSLAQTKRLVGYFPAWSIHAMKYAIADIPADQLTHLVYAFAEVSASAECVSVNAADDSVSFPQLLELKQSHSGSSNAHLHRRGGPFDEFFLRCGQQGKAPEIRQVVRPLHEATPVRRGRYRLGISGCG